MGIVLRKAFKGSKAKGLSILEIGSGYGELARQTIKYSGWDIASWDFVDLPNNLLFAEYHLTTIFGKKYIDTPKFFSKSDYDSNVNHSTKLSFYFPSEIEKINKSFDLIINSYSKPLMNTNFIIFSILY